MCAIFRTLSIRSSLHIEYRNVVLDYMFVCHGYDLHQFAESLQQLHSCADNCASFVNQEGNVEIAITVADRGRGWHNVRVRLQQMIQSPFTNATEFVWLDFGGFGIEQSEFSEMIRGISQFIRTWELPIEHPMMEA